ncbi:MAG: hypothetical protein AAGF45_03335 [Pseudomonadota bacterium]
MSQRQRIRRREKGRRGTAKTLAATLATQRKATRAAVRRSAKKAFHAATRTREIAAREEYRERQARRRASVAAVKELEEAVRALDALTRAPCGQLRMRG